MEKMKKKVRNDKNSSENSGEVPKQKERHIVSWSPEEDDILREQIEKHGTDNWTIIASKFKDKTTRQCRRRWYTYLNSDFKKGGWSPEEDLLLCEAQKIFGNRWTEIAKVVSGRTDNAVKNRFSTLCKKRAKHDALAKENNAFINLNNKRVLFPNGLNIDGVIEPAPPLKKMRSDISSTSEPQCNAGKPTGEYVRSDQLLRPPFAVLAENFRTGAMGMLVQEQNNIHVEIDDAKDNKAQGTFLKKDDPRILALLQQAELLSSLALDVNSEDSDQSLENAWQVLQDYLNQTKDGDLTKVANPYSSCDLVSFKELFEDSCSNECSQQSLRQNDFHTSSPCNSDYSTGSTRLTQPDYGRTESSKGEHNALLLHSIEAELHSTAIGDQRVDHLSPSELVQENGNIVYENNDAEFSSPIQVTPLFRSLAAAVPTPNFSESERHFLLRALGLESTSPHPSGNPTKPPPCKRVLLHSL